MDFFVLYIDWETCAREADEEHRKAGRKGGNGDGGDAETPDSDEDEDEWHFGDDGLTVIRDDSDSPANSRPKTTEPSSLSAHERRLRVIDKFHTMIQRTGKYIPKPVKDNFEKPAPNSKRTFLKNKTTVFVLTGRITYRKQPITEVSRIYKLPSLLEALLSYYGCRHAYELPFCVLDCWSKVRIQLHTFQDESIVAAPYTVAAIPPSADLPFGHCNFVLIRDPPNRWYRGIQGDGNSMNTVYI